MHMSSIPSYPQFTIAIGYSTGSKYGLQAPQEAKIRPLALTAFRHYYQRLAALAAKAVCHRHQDHREIEPPRTPCLDRRQGDAVDAARGTGEHTLGRRSGARGAI